MLTTLIGTRVPENYRKYFDLPARVESWKNSATGDTALGRACRKWLDLQPNKTGVYRLDLGLEALGARLGLIERAEKSVDIQSYLIRDDLSGNLVALRLVEAASRGVRVRLLMDDALTEPIDGGLLAINDHPNIEVRVFNPFPRRRSRVVSFIANFNILNRRMHNKSFTVDNQVTIVGGRNLADEYFRTGGESEYVDEDMLAIGAIVDAVSDGFDEYWNTAEAIPISVFDPFVAHLPVADTVAEGRRFLAQHSDSPYLNQVSESVVQRLMQGTLQLIAANARVVQDPAARVRHGVRRRASETTACLQQMVSAATSEVIVVSPYFVPQKQGVAFFAALIRKGVRVIVITNSLASTNHVSVHAVYERYRKPLLRQGIELYELRPGLRVAGANTDGSGPTKMTLHSKVAVVDGESVFIGSFNLDPRSLYINTEMGLVVESTELATSMATSITIALPKTAYKLNLRRNGGLKWTYQNDGVQQTSTTEPHAGFWRRVKTRLLSYLPIEGQM
jgi:putative cardiolipin synthase